MNLKNISYRQFEDSDFQEVFLLFLKFQDKVKMRSYENLSKGTNETFYAGFLLTELKNIIKKNKYKYVGEDKNGKIFGFACFADSSFFENGIDLILVFKDEEINYTRIMGCLLAHIFKKEFPKKRIFATLNQREKFDKYVSFLQRKLNARILKKDSFGQIYVEFIK